MVEVGGGGGYGGKEGEGEGKGKEQSYAQNLLGMQIVVFASE